MLWDSELTYKPITMRVMKQYLTITALFIGCLTMCCSCEKFLDAKPDKKLAVPASLKDLQALLDNHNLASDREPNLGECSTDDYYLSYENWQSLSNEEDRRLYLWESENAIQDNNTAWTAFGTGLYTASSVLEYLENTDPANGLPHEYENIQGQAYFYRAKRLLQAAFVWALAYDATSANSDLGLPLRLDTDFNKSSVRASVAETYQQIVRDSEKAIALLPDRSIHVKRPSKPAAYGLLARTYLAMRDYGKAGAYADSALMFHNELIDFNELDATARYPIEEFNAEVIMDTSIPVTQMINPSRARISKSLYDSYQENDLRKTILFNVDTDTEEVTFKGSYRGGSSLFGGIAVNELLLIKAEYLARNGEPQLSMQVLNKLLEKRFRSGTFVRAEATDQNDALKQIVNERRKELLMRGLRWMDVKRLNKEGANITLRRELNGEVYTLPPNDLRYALPLPNDIVRLSGMTQNPR